MSFFDDLTKFGSGLLDDVGEAVPDALSTLTNPSKDVQANPATRPQQTRVADNHGNTMTQPQGSVPLPQGGFAGFTQKELMIGGGVTALLLIVLLKR